MEIPFLIKSCAIYEKHDKKQNFKKLSLRNSVISLTLKGKFSKTKFYIEMLSRPRDNLLLEIIIIRVNLRI